MSTHLRMPHALVMMLIVISAAVALTRVIPSGAYERTADGRVVPLALSVAQPLAGVPVFSGALFRAVTFIVFRR